MLKPIVDGDEIQMATLTLEYRQKVLGVVLLLFLLLPLLLDLLEQKIEFN